MLNFSPEKMFFIFLIVLIVLGPDKLPEVSRKLGQAMGELRKLSGGFRDEMNKAMTEVTSDTQRSEPTPTEITPKASGSGTPDDTRDA